MRTYETKRDELCDDFIDDYGIEDDIDYINDKTIISIKNGIKTTSILPAGHPDNTI